MSDPFVYTQGPPYASSGYLGGFANTNPPNSPFIPHVSPYTSPYSGSIPLPGSPTLPPASPFQNPNQTVIPGGGSLLFPGTTPVGQGVGWDGYQPIYSSSTDPFSPQAAYTRQRRPSWHGSPYAPPTSPFLSPDPLYASRRRSFGGGDPYANVGGWGTWYTSGGWDGAWGPSIYGAPLTPSQLSLHPWLNAQTFTGEFLLDLAAHDFNPLIRLSPATNHIQPVPLEHLMMPATRPPINRLRILCDLIPQWPIEITWNPQNSPYGASPYGGTIPLPGSPSPGLPLGTPDTPFSANPSQPPITLSDVLLTLHRSLHTRISQTDWAKLTRTEEHAVAKAYTKRCKSLGSLEAVEREMNEGVKRVDFLLGKHWWRGLVVDWAHGVARLVVTGA